MTSDQKQKLKMYNNIDLLYIIDLLDKILKGNTDINNKTLQRIYNILQSQKDIIQRNYRRYGSNGYVLYLSDAEYTIINNLKLQLNNN